MNQEQVNTEKKPRTKPEDRRYSHDLSLELSREIRATARELRVEVDWVRDLVVGKFERAEEKLRGQVAQLVLDEMHRIHAAKSKAAEEPKA